MSNNEEKIAAEIAEIQKLAKENKNIDADALIASVMARYQNPDQLPQGQIAKAILVSLLLPPFGLYYVAKFWFRGDAGSKRIAWICLALTIVSVIVTWSISKTIFSSFGQLQNITPGQLKSLAQ